jgi:hypothetical protein
MVLFLLAQAVARSTPAAAASLSIAPEAPCLDAAELTALVERELGGGLDDAVPLRFELSGAKRPHGYSARLDVFDDRGAAARRRVVEAADCATLQETVAVAMTLALSADTVAAEPVPVRGLPEAANASDSANVAATRDASLDVASAPALTAGENRAWVPSLSAGVLVDAGTLPSASLGASVGAALELGRFQIQALGTLLFDREVSIQGRLSPDAGATLGFAGASLLACTPLFQTSSGLSSRGCLGWELGQLSGEGRGVARPERGRVLWSAPRLDIGARFALPVPYGGVGLSLAAEAPLNRDDFTLGPDAVVHRPPAIVARAAVGIDLAFE